MRNLLIVCLNSHFWHPQTFSLPDYAFQVGLDNVFTNTQQFGCDTPGCSVARTWEIDGVCLKPNVTLTISQSDFNADDEQIRIYINDEYFGNCTDLNRECRHNDWKQCGVVNQYYENTAYLFYGSEITITLDATREVNRCPYYINGTNYFLYAQLTIECDPFDEYGEYIWNLNAQTELQTFACHAGDCDVLGMWQILDDCPIPIVSVSVTDKDGLLHISVNGHNLGLCDLESNSIINNTKNNNQHNNGLTWNDCSNVYRYPVFDYLPDLNNNHHDPSRYLFVQLNYSNWQVYNGSLTNIAIECMDVEYEFALGFGGTYTWSSSDNNNNNDNDDFECNYDECNISKLWQINGICTQPKMTISNIGYFKNGNITVNINNNRNALHCGALTSDNVNNCSGFRQCEDNYDLSYYIDTSMDRSTVNYIYLKIHINDNNVATFCPWNDSNLHFEVSLSCFVPNQCMLDSDLPQIITIVLIALSITTAVGIIIAGTFVAFQKGQEKVFAELLEASRRSDSAMTDLQGIKTAQIENGVMQPDADSNLCAIYDDGTPNMDDDDMKIDSQARHGRTIVKEPTTEITTTTRIQILVKFSRYLPSEVMKKKSCYFPCVTHLIDQATDIAVIFEFYQLYEFENIENPNGTKNDCSGVDALQLLVLSCIAFVFYRVISCIWIYNITRSKLHTLLQFFDLKIYHALYINFISDYNDGKPNTAQKYIQILEASLEAFPQVVIQLYFFIQVKMDISQYWIVFASLIMSFCNVTSKMASEDKIYFIMPWQNIFVGQCVNIRYLFRYFIRLCDVFQRIILILLLWIGIGGLYCALYIILEMIVLTILSFFTKEYVA